MPTGYGYYATSSWCSIARLCIFFRNSMSEHSLCVKATLFCLPSEMHRPAVKQLALVVQWNQQFGKIWLTVRICDWWWQQQNCQPTEVYAARWSDGTVYPIDNDNNNRYKLADNSDCFCLGAKLIWLKNRKVGVWGKQCPRVDLRFVSAARNEKPKSKDSDTGRA